eukprot:5548840-Amphidinium_carterae.4
MKQQEHTPPFASMKSSSHPRLSPRDGDGGAHFQKTRVRLSKRFPLKQKLSDLSDTKMSQLRKKLDTEAMNAYNLFKN